MALALIPGIVYTSPGEWLFFAAPSRLSDWIFALPFAAGMRVLEEARARRAALRGMVPSLGRG